MKDRKETFGADIHTLLSDSFFMEDGLMGEFAKNRIKEIIDFYRSVDKKSKKDYENKKDRFWQTQSIVGEPYLKQMLENHLIEIEKIFGMVKAKEYEIERLKHRLKELNSD